jgi:hypothetical protein
VIRSPLIENFSSPIRARLVQTTRARTTIDRAGLSSANESFASSPGSNGSLWRMRSPVAESCITANFVSPKMPLICRRGI